VLVCDDEPVLRMLVRATLDQGNYTVVEACDGDEALARTREDRPDLILLDMMMPDRSGSDVLRELRSNPVTAQTPVIMLTARAEGSDREAMSLAGAPRTTSRNRSARRGSRRSSRRCWARDRPG
jgi:two-component system phosphate regulon response regulator PhoB